MTTVMMEAITAVPFTLALKEVLALVAAQIRGAVGVGSCTLSVWNKDAGTVETLIDLRMDGTGPEPRGIRHSLAGFPATRAVLETGQACLVRVSDPDADPAEVARLLNCGSQSLLMLPLPAGERIIGLVELEEAGSERGYADAEIRVIQALAVQAGVAIWNSQQFEETERLKAWYESIVQGVAEAIVIQDSRGLITFVNPAVETMLGYSRRELVGQPWTILVPKDEREKIRQRMSQQAESSVYRYETVMLTKPGRRVPVLASASQIFQRGKLAGLVSAITDITHQVHAEIRLQESERRLQTLFDNVQLLVVGLDRDGKVTYANAHLLQLMGYARDELMGTNWLEIHVPEQERPAVGAVLAEVRTRAAHPYFENYIITRDSRERLIAWNNTQLYGEDGRPEGVLSIGEDVTERKQVEQALRQSQAQFRDLYENAPIAYLTVGAEGLIRTCNRHASDMLGYARDELVGKPWLDLYPETPPGKARARQVIEQSIAGERTVAEELQMQRADGTPLWVSLTAKSIRDEDERVVESRTTAADITVRKRLEEQFSQVQKIEAAGRLARGVAHEFGNLLTVIQLSVRLMERSMLPDDPLGSDLARIRSAGDRATRLVKQLLAFSRLQVVVPKVLGPNDVVADLSRMLHSIIGEEIELRAVLAEDLWPVFADAGQLEQVIMNLVVNASDAMPEGGTLTIETANTCLDAAYAAAHVDVEAGEYVLLTVSDTGSGMDDGVKAHIFEPFFTTKASEGGTGLGLSTVYGAVKQAGGHISVDSELGRGTVMMVYLPRCRDPRALSGIVPLEDAGLVEGTETILLVENEPSVRELVATILKDHGYNVLSAHDGAAGLQVSGEYGGPIHLLLTEVVLPKGSGKRLAERLRSQRPEMKVLYLQGYTDYAISQGGVPEPGTDFVPKPVSEDSLTQMVRAVLDDRVRRNGTGC